MATIALNYLSLDSRRPIGVERFVRNVMSGLNLEQHQIRCLTRSGVEKLTDVVNPDFVTRHPKLEHSRHRVGNTISRILIEMLWLPIITWRQDTVLSVNNFGPLWGKTGQRRLVIIHDVWFMSDCYEGSSLNRWIFKLLLKLQIFCSTDLVTVSEFSKREISRYFSVNTDQLTVIENCLGYDVGISDKTRQPFFLVIGSDRRNKNIRRSIAGFCAMRESDSQCPITLKVVGKYSDQFINTLKAEFADHFDAIDMPGFVDDDELKYLYQTCCGVVFLSLYEGFGIPAVEALAAGTPVLLSQRTACAEIAGSLALTVDGLDIEQIAQGMSALALHQIDTESEEFRKFRDRYLSCQQQSRTLSKLISGGH